MQTTTTTTTTTKIDIKILKVHYNRKKRLKIFQIKMIKVYY